MKLRFVARENVKVPGSFLRALEKADNIPTKGEGWSRAHYCVMYEAWVKSLNLLLGSRMKKLGQGSSRAVYALNEDVVLKVATYASGVAQNKAEYNAYKKAADCSVITRIFYHNQKFHWLVAERIKRQARDTDFKIYGVPHARRLLYLVQHPEEAEDFAGVQLTETFHKDRPALLQILELNDDHCGELSDNRQWGIVERNGQEYPVLVDYGWTDKIGSSYY